MDRFAVQVGRAGLQRERAGRGNCQAAATDLVVVYGEEGLRVRRIRIPSKFC